MIRWISALGLIATALFVSAQAPQSEPAAEPRIQLTLDASAAEAVLAIVEARAADEPVAQAAWRRLFTSEPYLRLQKREASLGRDFTDADFRAFVLSEELRGKAPALRRTLEEWKRADLQAIGLRILPYLPRDARVAAKVYPMIKPKTNSFVFEPATNPAIFLYLDPEQSRSEFENVVAHESHHIGFAGLRDGSKERLASLPAHARQAAEWMGAFGEGVAVLAAAGSAEVHPLRDFKPEDRARWDQDMQNGGSLPLLDQFFRDLVSGGFARPEVADHVAFTFFGYRGPWYTVGYQMAALVEKQFGRAHLVECMTDPRQLLATYNEAAETHNATSAQSLPLWSREVLQAVGAESKGSSRPVNPR